MPAIELMAKRYETWRPTLLVTRAAFERARGRLNEALALYESALQLLPTAKHSTTRLQT